MPKYKNISSEILVFRNQTFLPLEEKEINFYIQDERIKEVDAEPLWSPIAYSEELSGGSVKITENLTPTVSSIRIISKSETASISFNSKDSPKALVTQGVSLNIRPVSYVNEIFVHSGTISVELWNEMNWR